MSWFAFISGLLAGGLIAGLWMRARLERLEAAKQFAESGATKMQETFQALADAALRSNQSTFLSAARSTLETTRAEMSGDLAQKQTAIEGVVQPLADSLGRLEAHVRELERAREKAFGSLGEQVQSLARETATLSTALRSPQTRGRWGEVTLLFLPGDHFFSAALECRPDLIEEALARKVVIATPVTLISVLKGIAYGWNQEQLAENAEEIRRVASEMYDRVQLVQEHYSDTGRLLEKTVEAYNRSVGSWDSRLVPALRKMRELGVSSGEEPEAPEQIDLLARRPRAVNGF
jgi:DNA anti-recombination protein RmuC